MKRKKSYSLHRIKLGKTELELLAVLARVLFFLAKFAYSYLKRT